MERANQARRWHGRTDVLLSLFCHPSAKISKQVSLAPVICHLTGNKGLIDSTVTVSYQSVPRHRVRVSVSSHVTESMPHALPTTAQSCEILCLMLLEMVSCRTHSGLVHLLRCQVATVQFRGARLKMRGAMGSGSSAV